MGPPLRKFRPVVTRRGGPACPPWPPCERPIPPVRGKCRAQRDKRGREAPGEAGWGIPLIENVPSSAPFGGTFPQGKAKAGTPKNNSKLLILSSISYLVSPISTLHSSLSTLHSPLFTLHSPLSTLPSPAFLPPSPHRMDHGTGPVGNDTVL